MAAPCEAVMRQKLSGMDRDIAKQPKMSMSLHKVGEA